MTRFYAGIGSRQTPPAVLLDMTLIAEILQAKGYRLRSGGAHGADAAFAAGAGEAAEIYLPWPGFNSVRFGVVCGDNAVLRTIAEEHHPAWGSCSRGARALHTRNVAQIVGTHPPHSGNSEFVVCWTPGGSGSGGTGQAIRIAQHYDVPVFDLAIPQRRLDLNELLKKP